MLKSKLRNVEKEDWKNLPVFSYSKIEVFKNCPMQYEKKYIEKKMSQDTSLALELGSLCHAVLERKGKQLVSKDVVDYDLLKQNLLEGIHEHEEKTREDIIGVKDLKKKYFETWYEPDNASGMNYEEKMKKFDIVMNNEMTSDEYWKPFLFEHPFDFVYDNRAIFHGFIDRIDEFNGKYRTIDYKTSKKKYDQKKLATSLQFGIYALAILNEFDSCPVESLYRFILIDESQYALTKGWEKRLIKALNGVLDKIETKTENNEFNPSPTPLCYWCSYCRNNPSATIHREECKYYSLWTPTHKTFDVKKEWNKNTVVSGTSRKLIF